TRDLLELAADCAALADRIRLVEVTSDVAPYYRAADVYVQPTLNDSFGMAPLEAMSFQLPVVLSPAPWCGFAQYVRDGHEALVMKHPEDHHELALCIKRISDDPVCRATLVQGGNAVVDRHSWEEVASSYLGLYAEVIAEREYPAPVTSS